MAILALQGAVVKVRQAWGELRYTHRHVALGLLAIVVPSITTSFVTVVLRWLVLASFRPSRFDSSAEWVAQ
jgi:hypothetical protein